MNSVLYLHGRGNQPQDPPGDLVVNAGLPLPLRAPVLDAAWHGRRFSLRVAEAEEWLDDAVLAVGHSFGGWLLLHAAAGRLEQGRSIPPLLLLSTVLGIGAQRGGEAVITFSVPPGERRVHRALGLVDGRDALFPPEKLEFIHGESDAQCPVKPLERLSERYCVEIVPGGHGLDHPEARAALRRKLGRYREALTLTDGGPPSTLQR